jgi:pyruvate formate lyase activating enzyme
LAGRLYALGEVMRICMEDKDFYAESGGGVTLTGGEVLAQPEAAAALLAALKAEGIHAALETSGHAPHEAYRVATENADLLLFDIKHHDDERHRKGTGVGNGVILENLRSSVSEGKPLLARIPVIPNYNDSLEDAEEFAKLLRSVGLSEAQLLPFHQFGQKKYAMLDMAYHYDGCKNLRGEDLKEYQNVFAANGVNSFI